MTPQNFTTVCFLLIVFRIRNKLDGNDYAVKRIPLDPKDERFNRKLAREAKLFSRLNHPNVVRYYSAWIEYAPPKKSADKANHGRDADRSDESDSKLLTRRLCW